MVSELKQTVPTQEVEVRLGFTKNTGDFNSVRCEISVKDTARLGETVTDTFDRVYGFVEKKLNEKYQEEQ